MQQKRPAVVDELFDSQKVLRAAEIIRKHGESDDGTFKWRGFALEIAADGYTISLKWHACTLHVFFHNRFKFEGGQRRDFENMMQAVEAAIKEENRGE